MHYWAKGGLPSDEEHIRRITRLTPRQWSTSRDLLRSFFGDHWKHQRIERDLAQAFEISKVNSANARKSHESRRRTATIPQETEKNASLSKELIEDSIKEKESKRERSNRGSRLPPDWRPSDHDWHSACDAIGENRAMAELKKFEDHWKAQPGSKGVKADWPATWRNWCRRAAEYGGGKNNGTFGSSGKVGFSGMAAKLRQQIRDEELFDRRTAPEDLQPVNGR
jgi:uncharacterized protein YdaU (DUF1376 family)